METGRERTHLLTVSVEDYFHSTALNRLVPPRYWSRIESQVEQTTERALELLDEHGIRATFFVLGWVADKLPELVRRIAAAQHEVACKGYHHLGLERLDPERFRAEILRGREAIEHATGTPVLGHRIAQGRITGADAWALDILAEEGFGYDSSVAPQLRSIRSAPWRRLPHVHAAGDARLVELPISSVGPDWLPVPLAGGNFFRQLPQGWAQLAFERWNRRFDAPFNMYFHVWELAPDLPRLSQAGWLTRVRGYRNLGQTERILRAFFREHRFQSIASWLATSGFGREALEAQRARRPSADAMSAAPARERVSVLAEPREPVTIVVPCFNEEVVLPYLANTLAEVVERLGPRYELAFVLVDDASTDGTWESFERVFGDWPNVTRLRHAANAGVSAAIATGLRHARTEIVCSMDCDCTYDPHQFERMIPLLGADASLVTASPYHPEGAVHGVPRWRLFLSRSLSRAYRLVFRQRLWTYTSCFRVYRRSALLDVDVQDPGYMGIAELLARLDSAGKRIVEFPALLEVRLLGVSKMRTARAVLRHARLWARLAWLRISGASWPALEREPPSVTGPLAGAPTPGHKRQRTRARSPLR
jgi:polysaccharide deacetylase family protein (PEP-CTERM system associated)